MSSSYYRACRKCGQRIQMREMPHGQWVAFEGFDTPHNCGAGVNYGRTGNISHDLSPPVEAGASPRARMSRRTTLASAAQERLVVRINYRGRDGIITEREVEPLKLDDTYCHAFCRLRKDYRRFRIDGIRALEVTDAHFSPRPLRDWPPTPTARAAQAAHRTAEADSRPGFSRAKSTLLFWLAAVVAVAMLRACL